MDINNIFDLINNSNYSINDYNKIIDLCNKKIISKELDDSQIIYKNDIKNIQFNNEELMCFYNIIVESISFNIEDTDDFESVSINFNYNDIDINLCLYFEDFQIYQKICINNKRTHVYEIFHQNHEEILLKKLELKITTDELNDLIKTLFNYLPNNIINKW